VAVLLLAEWSSAIRIYRVLARFTPLCLTLYSSGSKIIVNAGYKEVARQLSIYRAGIQIIMNCEFKCKKCPFL